LLYVSICISCTEQATTPATEVSGRIAYSLSAQNQGYIFSVLPNGQDIKELAYLQSKPLDMTWSSDGSWLAFVNYVFIDDDQLGLSEIYRINANGENLQALTSLGYYARNPSMSSDGRFIAFEAKPHQLSNDDSIYIMNVDGDNLRSIAAGKSPVWQPGTNLIAYTRNDQGSFDIWLMDTNGTDVQQVTDLKFDEYACDWSGDGSKLLFRSYLSGYSEIFLISSDGRNLKQLTNFRTFTSDASWSPDEQRIIFFGDGEEIYMMRPDGTDRKLLNIRGLYPDWGPDYTQ
jgi:TolB protein